ncbi:MAG: copper resistance protein B [Thiogranum sp.]|nr:copper resistance protein B [Thiogranum sp.]
MLMREGCITGMIAATLVLSGPAQGQEQPEMPATVDRPMHQESAQQHEEGTAHPERVDPQLPEGAALDEVLDRAASPPPADFPDPVPDDQLYVFTLFEQLEYRIAEDQASDHLGWEAQGWVGGDFNRFWWKSEGEAIFDGPNDGESENDFLYSRLITPFWNVQTGMQYANEWTADDYDERWSWVLALQGLVPYEFELDNSVYVSEDADITFEVEAEYDLWITQRLVLQPRVELGFAAQDISDRELQSGMTDVDLDLRLRYGIKREFAPYLGIRYSTLAGDTRDAARAAGEDVEHLFFLAGVRFGF